MKRNHHKVLLYFLYLMDSLFALLAVFYTQAFIQSILIRFILFLFSIQSRDANWKLVGTN